nr:BMP family ABC transporter substrate-binding protein [Tessaracoccus coleopterorum]
MVSDAGGFDDKSFNETAYNGMMKAKDELGIQTKQIESNAEGEYAGNVQSMIDAKCNIVITVGFALATATEAAAKQNPDVQFTIVDNGSFEGVDNARGLIFNTAQPAFMAGYAAAAMSTSGTVGTFGGAKYPTVTIFMDGFAQGVSYYNETKGASVKVIGWDEAAQDGQFVGGNNPFGDIPGGKNTAATLIAQGADIIMPVAGPAGLGALQAAQESGGKVNAVWVDTDGFISAPSSAPDRDLGHEGHGPRRVRLDQGLARGHLQLRPVRRHAGERRRRARPVPRLRVEDARGLQAELDQIKADIISGTIAITSPSQPK